MIFPFTVADFEWKLMVHRLQCPKHFCLYKSWVPSTSTLYKFMGDGKISTAMQLNIRGVWDFLIFLTDTKFKEYFKLSTINFLRNLSFYKIEYLLYSSLDAVTTQAITSPLHPLYSCLFLNVIEVECSCMALTKGYPAAVFSRLHLFLWWQSHQ